MSVNLKQEIRAACLQLVDESIEAARKAMKEAQESANHEEKSSMGDKYETGRAMSQMEREMHARQLDHLLSEKEKLSRMDCLIPHKITETGALVMTEKQNYWIAIALGQITIPSGKFRILSPASPLAKGMWGKGPGEEFMQGEQKEKIISVE